MSHSKPLSCFLTAALVLLAARPPRATGQSDRPGPALTNAEIISMARAHLGSAEIVAKIHNSRCDFDISDAALEKLKAAGLDESVIAAIVEAPWPERTQADQTGPVHAPAAQPLPASGGRQVAQQMPAPAPAEEAALTNKDVLEMVKAGLSPEIINAKIESSSCGFDTSPTALEELKAAGVADSVLLAMVRRQPANPAPAGEAETSVEEKNGSTLVKALAYRIIPYQRTTYLTRPGYSNTSCYGAGIDTGYLASLNVNCQTFTRPPSLVPLTVRRVTVYNAVQAGGEVYVVTCTAHWIGSSCSSLIPGETFASSVTGNTMWVLGRRGGNRGRKLRVKFRILDVRAAR
jgi:hypothetical protein